MKPRLAAALVAHEFVDLGALEKEFEADPALAPHLAEARAQLARVAGSALTPIARLRLARGLSQAKMAALVGTSQARISRIESSLESVSVHFIPRLSRALEVSHEQVLAALLNEAS